VTTNRRIAITLDGHTHEIRIAKAAGKGCHELELESAGQSRSERVRVLSAGPNPVVLVGGRVLKWAALADGHERTLSRAGTPRTARVGGAHGLLRPAPAVEGCGAVRAPMPGRIVDVVVSPGEEVTTGTLLLVIEAMKMQNELFSPGSGRVEAVLVRAGDAVERGAELIRIG
jgi:biotin carboxyl carrier protein